MSVKCYPRLYWFCVFFSFCASLCDWSRTLALLSQPINAKLKPLTTWSPSFSRALGSLVVFMLVVSSLLIGSFDHFGFGFNLVLIVSLWLKILYYLALMNLSYFQGALAVEVNLDDKQTIELVSKLIDRDTSICCAAERNFLRTLVSNMILLTS